MLEELQALAIAFMSLGEGIDATTPAGKLQMHILGAIAEFERSRIAERVRAGLLRARAQGKRLGRPRKQPAAVVVPGAAPCVRRRPLGCLEVDCRQVDLSGADTIGCRGVTTDAAPVWNTFHSFISRELTC